MIGMIINTLINNLMEHKWIIQFTVFLISTENQTKIYKIATGLLQQCVQLIKKKYQSLLIFINQIYRIYMDLLQPISQPRMEQFLLKCGDMIQVYKQKMAIQQQCTQLKIVSNHLSNGITIQSYKIKMDKLSL